jgi:hypothetical protein
MVRQSRAFVLASVFALAAAAPAQDPAKPAGADKREPDKEVAAQIARLKEVCGDKKFAREGEGIDAIDKLLVKVKAGIADPKAIDPKDHAAILKAYAAVLASSKERPHDKTELYNGAAEALAYCGADGAKILRDAYFNKSRYPEKPDWVPLREKLLKCIGRTKDESMVPMLLKEALTNHEAALSAAAGEALGKFEESKESLRKEIVGKLLDKWGELDEKASQLGTNIDAQNAQNRLAALQDKWQTTLGNLTKQSFGTFREWQAWHNKNKNAAW